MNAPYDLHIIPLMDNNERDIFQPTDNESSNQIFITSDGRQVGYALFGAENGPTVFYLHGFPGCRLSGVFFDGPGKQHGARIVAVERPGIGISSPQPGRSALDHAEDVRQLAEHLEIKSYGIIGVSGGGLYALACAYALPQERLKSVSIVAGMGPNDIGLSGMSWANWLTFQGLSYCPGLVRWLQHKIANVLTTIPTEKLVDMYRRSSGTLLYRWFGPNQKDAVYLEDPHFYASMLEFQKEHYKQGVEGFLEDGRVFVSDLGFRLEDIRASLPLQLWCGEQDTNVPLRIGRAVAGRLRCQPALYVRDETHLSLVMKCRFMALERLLDNM